MPAVGPTSYPNEPLAKVAPMYTSGFTISTADVLMSTIFNCGFCRRVVAQAAGNVAIQRQADSGFTVYALTAGQDVQGQIVAVGSTTHGSSAIAVVVEL